ncbi:hypothetical protein AZE42_05553 [Rhizopogon vesiculosus]|uniref:Uncharacterized protein n=1 Tax=Rhizopogon vesiculosus TaxID=180088 RepID=A0A1J8QAH5_9AGAM|nr:hypothetical protein AZE42_05553 [Rhizopogon vesiculosus]
MLDQPTGTHNQAASESNVPSANLPPIAYPITSREMQVGKGRNGRYVVGWCTVLIHSSNPRHRNSCAREWLTHNKAGSAVEFKVYYDVLSAAERKVS